MPINIDTVRAILESARGAWNAGSIEGVLDKYIDDLVYISNVGGGNGESHTIRGKENLRVHFRNLMDIVDAKSQIESIRLQDGVVRTRLLVDLCHRETGHSMSFSLRQILRFQGFQIAEQMDYHDAAKMIAFWNLVSRPNEHASKTPA